MNGKLRKDLSDIKAELQRLHTRLDSHASAEDVQKVTAEVKAVREEVSGSAKATQTALGSVTSALKNTLQKAAELAGAPAAAPADPPATAKKPANGKTAAAATPTSAAPAAGKATP